MLRRRSPLLLALLALACDPATDVDGGVPDDAEDRDAPASICAVDADCPTSAQCAVARCAPEAANADAQGCVCTTVDCAEPDADGDEHDSILCGGDDCDDADANRYPGNAEVCDALDHDEDCDVTTPGVLDTDADGYTDDRCCNVAADGTRNCGDDCDDDRAEVSPVGADDDCDSLDDDCDGFFDEDGGPQDFFADTDDDGFGAGTPVQMCAREVEGFSTAAGDCDDGDPAVNPGATELCNGVDDDCNGRFDGPGEDADMDGAVSTACGGSDCYDLDPMYVCEANGWRIASLSATDIDVGDIDEDGDFDVAVSQGNSGLDLLLNPATFDPLRVVWNSSSPGVDNGYYETVRIAELDDRGFPLPGDLLVGASGVPGGGVRYYFDRDELGWRSENVAASSARALAVGLLDSGSDLDVVSGHSSGLVEVHFGPSWSSTTLVPAPAAGFYDDPRRVEIADVDGDGNRDIVVGYDHWNPFGGSLVGGNTGRVDVFFGNESRGFTRTQVHSAMDVRGVAVGDLDADGDTDLAAVGATGEVTWIEQTSARAFSAHVLETASGQPDMWEAGVAIADLDGDGRGELYAGGDQGRVRVWTDVVAETTGRPFVLGARAIWRVFAVDVDLDTHLDLIVLAGDISGGDEVWWVENRGGQIAPVD